MHTSNILSRAVHAVRWNKYALPYSIFILLLLSTTVYLQTACHEFISFDDNVYIYENKAITGGFSRASMLWAFTTFHQFNWHPITWLSHLVDISLFGLNPAGHHLHNVLIHSCNSILLFIILCRSTGSIGKSLLVASLFAVHPIRVESVAWASERKDVLSTFFGFSSIYCYISYRQCRTRFPYLLALALFAVSLMAKPTMVTLPFILLLLDWWPSGHNSTTCSIRIREKVPFLMLAVLTSIVSIAAQYHGGSIASLNTIPLALRLENAVISYLRYIMATFIPVNLSFFYPFPQKIALWKFLATCVIIIAISIIALRCKKMNPAVIFGWGWFLISLLPMIGIIQVGGQAYADRYAYVSTVGLLIAVVWSGEMLAKRLNLKLDQCICVGGVIVLGYGIAGWHQTTYWKTGYTLYNHALEINPNNYMALTQLADLHRQEQRYIEAIPLYLKSLQQAPSQANAFNNLGLCYIQTGRTADAIPMLQTAIKLKSGYTDAYFNLGIAQERMGNIGAAIVSFSETILLNPTDAEAYYRLAILLLAIGHREEAVLNLNKAAALDPSLKQTIQDLSSKP